MTSHSTASGSAPAAKSVFAAWAGVLLAYAAASLVQILSYGAGASSPGPGAEAGIPVVPSASTRLLAELFEIVVVLAWIAGPAAIATWFAARGLRFWKVNEDERLGIPRKLAMFVLPTLSSYLGAFVSINIWGT